MTDDELAFLDAHEVVRLLHARKLSPVELTKSMLARIERLDPRLHAYALVTPEVALAQARDAEALLAQHRILSPLHGVPVALKDLCYTKGIATAAGMPIHRRFVPDFDASVTTRLREAGTVLLGKLQLTEGAYADHHPDVRAPVNPWHADHWPGASSSGSGVAVAAGLCFAAIGSDTGGSIRFPSAANGVTGLKPTWGRVPVHGAFELAKSLDHLGPMARSAADCGAMLGLIAGADANDPTALPDPVPDYLAGDPRDLHDLRIGIDDGYSGEGLDARMRQTLDTAAATLRALGAELRGVAFPDPSDAIRDWPLACAVETAVAHEATFPSRRAAYGPGLAGFIDLGRSAGAMELQKVWLRRRAFAGRVEALLRGIDLLLVPAQPIASPTMSEMRTLGTDPEGFARLVRFTAPFSMSGHPTITLPAGFTGAGTPTAVQLVARRLGEALLVRAGRAFQRATDWHRRRPMLRGS
ncbi:MAG TPA: amidase [Ideonella sp.]|nr:amidase [Ideonella sp.]